MVLPDGMAIEEIRPAAGADEEGVGGEYPAGQEDGDEVLGVSRGVQELKGEIPQGQPVAVLDPDVYGARGGFLVHDELRYRFAFEVPRPGDVVGVGVGVDYVCLP